MYILITCLNHIYTSNLENTPDWRGYLLNSTNFQKFEPLQHIKQARIIAGLFLSRVYLEIELKNKNKKNPYNALLDSVHKVIATMLQSININNVKQKMQEANKSLKEILAAGPQKDAKFLNLNQTFSSLIKLVFEDGSFKDAYNDCVNAIDASTFKDDQKKTLKDQIWWFERLTKASTDNPKLVFIDVCTSAGRM